VSPPGLKGIAPWVDTRTVDALERKKILTRYQEHSRRFETVAARRSQVAEVVPLGTPTREREQSPTPRETEVLQLISNGLVNREIGEQLYVSEETVKSHVRHLLAKLQARSRAHAVAQGLRRGLID
jgi:DNA-binding NarL/FixJ family response regulator